MPNPDRARWMGRAVAGVGLLVFVVLGVMHISFNVDILKLLPVNLRQVQGLSLLLHHFAERNELMITVEGPTPEATEKAAAEIAERLNAMPQAVKRAVARPPWDKQPAQLAEIIAFIALNQPPEKARDIAARLSPEQAPQTLRETVERMGDSLSPQEIGLLGYDPFDLVGSAAGSLMNSSDQQQSEFASADGKFHVVYVESAISLENYNHAIAWIDDIRRATGPWQGKEGIRIGYTGEPAIVASISQSMQSDMQSSAVVTLLVIAFLFWLCYRRFRPLLELQAMLVIIFALTLGIAGWASGKLTAIGVGCSAILIGLSVDYGYFVYQRAQHFHGSLRDLQRQCVRYIAWTAGTTAAAFFALNVSSLPGLSQLGNLVGVGVVVGALVMLGVFAPLVWRRAQREGERPPTPVERLVVSPTFHRLGAWTTGAVVLLLLGTLVWRGWPGTDFSAQSMRPRHSEAYDTLDRMAVSLTEQADPMSLVVEGASVDAVLNRLRSAENQLAAAKQRGDIRSFRSALAVWPVTANQRENLPILGKLAAESPRLRQSVRDAGFKDDAFALTENILSQWAAWVNRPPPVWPDNEVSRWIFRRIARHDDGRWYAAGIVQPVPGREQALDHDVTGDGIYLTGWKLLTVELRQVIPREFGRAIVGIAVVLLLLLALAFRDWRTTGLFVAATALVFICLAGAMSLFGVNWNVFNFAALLLLIGTGTDYSILLLLSLRRNGGNVAATRKELFLVVCLCAGSASAGFGTISWANHAGLASLGQTCALGLLIDAAVSVFLLPPAWAWLHRRAVKAAEPALNG